MAPKTTKTSKAAKPRTTRSTRSTSKPETPVISARPERPAVTPVTWITVVILAALVGTVFFMNRKAEETASATPTPGKEQTFVFPATSVATSIEVKPKDGEAVKVKRDAEKVWMLTQPIEIEADPAAAEAAASQVTALAISETVDADPSIFGLDDPAYIITVEFEDGKTGTLEVGDTTPTNSGYYVRLNKNTMYIVGLEGIAALTNLVTTPPYLNTPTPTATATPLPTETPVPAPEASPTPEATPTP